MLQQAMFDHNKRKATEVVIFSRAYFWWLVGLMVRAADLDVITKGAVVASKVCRKLKKQESTHTREVVMVDTDRRMVDQPIDLVDPLMC